MIAPHSTIQVAAFGELLARLHCPSGKRLCKTDRLELAFGGAEANVCVLLARLGLHTNFITRLPAHDLAQGAVDQLRGQGVGVERILYGGDKMGLYFTESGQSIRAGKVIYDRAHSSFAELHPGMIPWENSLEGCNWFHWSGISPALSASSAGTCREALEKAKAKGMTISADFNYRSTLWQYGKHPREVMPELLAYADVLVADPDAAHIYLGITHGTAELDLAEKFDLLSQGIRARLPNMKTLAMSVRSQNKQGLPTYQAALHYKGAQCFSKVHEIPFTEDRIGSGDAFTGGLIYALGHRHNPQEIIDFAAACAVLKHSIQGDFALISLEEILDFLRQGPTTRIIR